MHDPFPLLKAVQQGDVMAVFILRDWLEEQSDKRAITVRNATNRWERLLAYSVSPEYRASSRRGIWVTVALGLRHLIRQTLTIMHTKGRRHPRCPPWEVCVDTAMEILKQQRPVESEDA